MILSPVNYLGQARRVNIEPGKRLNGPASIPMTISSLGSSLVMKIEMGAFILTIAAYKLSETVLFV